ncbi:acyl-CoA dehydrogenase (FAD dependent) [[Clostridium] ultunense Esp]|uniref:acyl-CoA dehydrogenase family protein n=1 Tax=Thermicanus aegyptius TaxID=94009 RepID=UPI0002B70D90|nr:acyl-CoA dehydrogenase family protein [Thermicanus aegyptius]CCQ96517.1 acyl-CoA dehydrogenase (FAD dependent) [[Clostridium] ultunense Esp]
MFETKSVKRGGSFLIEETAPEEIFTPEDLSEEQKMIGETTESFIRGEVWPVLDEIEEHHRFDLTVNLLKKAGELGLLAGDIPEKYEGLGLDKISTMLVAEKFALARSFALSFGAHVGIGTLPIVYFGTEEQKRKYLPDLASGRRLAAYALTEPGSGSDALGAKTTAVLNPEGTHYILNGEKQWITNSGFADLFIVYAKVDGEKFSAFIVERDDPGVSTGPEEKKMGIKGSSTRTLILQDVPVPKENLLGEVGRGHVIAFNILNIGRYKLAAGSVGGAKRVIELAVQYAKEREQFKTKIANFPLIKSKIAEMTIRTYAAESMIYRTVGLFDEMMEYLGEKVEDGREVAKGIAEYAIECSLNKFYATEVLDYVVDEAVQIHGGYGYMAEYEVEKMYRDSRINRIFEGTNEINRLLVPGTLVKKAMKGELDLMGAALRFQNEILSFMPAEIGTEPLAQEKEMVAMAKKIFLLVAGQAVQKYQEKLEGEQEILSHAADLAAEIFAMESALLRTLKEIGRNGVGKSSRKIDLAQAVVYEGMERIEMLAKEALAHLEEGDSLKTQLALLRKLTRYQPIDRIALKRRIADFVIEVGEYTV